MANPSWFDESYYLSSKLAKMTAAGATGYTALSIKDAITAAGMTTFQHFQMFSLREGTSPNQWFNTNEYIAAKAAAAGISVSAMQLAFDSAGYTNVFSHFQQFWATEKINPSNAFDLSDYMAAKAAKDGLTVAQEYANFSAAGFDPISHYILAGKSEGVAVTTVPPSEQVAGDTSNTGGQTFTLTTGIDTLTGTAGNDTFKGVISATVGESTLTLADSIDGGAGVDTLTVTSTGATQLPASEIKNVENIFIKDLTGGRTHDFAGVTGEAQVVVTGSTGNTTITGLDKAVIGVQGMTAVGTQTFTFKDSAFASTAALDILVDGAGNTVGNVLQTITVGQATGAAAAANAVTIAATGSSNILLAKGANAIAAANGIKTLTVTGAGKVSIDAASALVATTLRADLTTVDAATNTGGLTMQVDKSTVAVTGGTGADVISVGGAMTSGAKFNLGAGNDQLLKAAGGSIDANVVVDGGAGTDTISNGLITVANGAIFKNFEKIALSDAVTTDVELLTGSTVTSLLINGNAAAVVQNVKSATQIDVTSTTGASDVTVSVKGAAASTTDTLTVNFDGAAQAATPAAANITAGNLVADKVEGITIVSGGADNTWNSMAIKGDSGLQTVTISGAKNLDLTFAGVNGTNPVATQGGAVKSIDGSAATGKLAINLTNVVYDDKVGVTVKGGTGNDTITTNASSATLTGTSGNDKYVVTATVAVTADATTAKMTTITDFNAGDMITDGAVTALVKTQTTIAGATNLTNALDLALKDAAVTATKAAWFQYGGNTYIAVETAGADGFDAADTVVKLTGTLDLTNSTVAANVITMV